MFSKYQKKLWIDSETQTKENYYKEVNNGFDPILFIKKPQLLIKERKDYYIAIDKFTNVYYICYKNLMVLDIDYYKNNLIKNKTDVINMLIKFINNNNNFLFDVYESRNGCHIFCSSHKFRYDNLNEEYDKIVKELYCDEKYALLSKSRGFCVRLNEKNNKIKYNTDMYKFVIQIGNKKNEKRRLKFLISKHIKYMCKPSITS